MKVDFETIIKMYDEELARLTKENLFLKANLKQIELNADREKNEQPSE